MAVVSTDNQLLQTHLRGAARRGEVLQDVLSVCDVVVESPDRPAHERKIASLDGIGAPTAWDGILNIPTRTLDDAVAIVMEYVGYASRVEIPKWRAQEMLDDISAWVSATMYREALQLIITIVELHLLAAFTDAMYAGGPALIATTHTTETGTRSTKLTDPLDDTGLWNESILRQGWTTMGGTPDSQDMPDKTLITGRFLSRDAVEAMGYQAAGSTGNAQQNTLGSVHGITRHIKCQSWDADEDRWLTVTPPPPRASDTEPNDNPMRVWLRAEPNIPMWAQNADTKAYQWDIDLAIGTGHGPRPGYWYGSDPA